jgi:hypothetical protein
MDFLMAAVIACMMIWMVESRKTSHSIIIFWLIGMVVAVYLFNIDVFFLAAFQFLAVSAFSTIFFLIYSVVENEE